MKKPVMSVGPDSHATVSVVAPFLSIGNELPKPESFLRLAEVIRRTGMCKSKIYRLEGFPKPIKVGGRTSAWIESEVAAWIAQTISDARRARAA